MAIKVPQRHRFDLDRLIRWSAWVNIYDRNEDNPYGRVLPGVPTGMGIPPPTEPDPLEQDTDSIFTIAGENVFIAGGGFQEWV